MEERRFGARWSLTRTPPNNHVRPRLPIVNWVYQTFRAHYHPRAAAPARSLTPQLRIACSTTARPAIPISHRFPPSRGVYMFVIEPTCARVDLCECSRMFADAGLSGGQSGFGAKRRGAVPHIHLRGSGDRDIEQVVGRFLTCRSQNPESRGINSARIPFRTQSHPCSHRHRCSYHCTRP